MTAPFVWFDLRTTDGQKARRFYEQLLGWQFDAGSGPTMMTGGEGPWALVAEGDDAPSQWIPYVQVEDVDNATRSAVGLGAAVRREKTEGPGGIFTVIADPTGAELALWQPAGR